MKFPLIANLSLAAVAGLGAAISCQAADASGFYVGGTLGLTQYDEDGYFDNSALVGSSFDDDSFGAALVGGYRVSRWFAVEAAYTHLGSFWEEGKGVNDDDDIETSLGALTVSLVASLPLGDTVSLYAQAGAGFALVAQSLDYDVPGVDVDENEADTGPAGLLGLGITVNLPPQTHVQLRMGYQYYVFEADLAKVDEFNQFVTNEVDQDVDYLFIGATYQF